MKRENGALERQTIQLRKRVEELEIQNLRIADRARQEGISSLINGFQVRPCCVCAPLIEELMYKYSSEAMLVHAHLPSFQKELAPAPLFRLILKEDASLIKSWNLGPALDTSRTVLVMCQNLILEVSSVALSSRLSLGMAIC